MRHIPTTFPILVVLCGAALAATIGISCSEPARTAPPAAPAAKDAAAKAPADAGAKTPAAAAATDPEAPAHLAVKVVVLNYDPIVERSSGQRLHEFYKWSDPHYLVDACLSDLHETSHGFLRPEVVQWKDIDGFPIKKDKFRYTVEEYQGYMNHTKPFHRPDDVDYVAVIKEFDIERRVAAGEVDEVWMMGMPGLGTFESTMAGPGGYWCNSEPVKGIESKRLFAIMGFNYERGGGEMLEDFGHRTESIMMHVYGSWEPKPTHAWNRFTLYDKVAPGQAACGNVHFAPNSDGDYDWGNRRSVHSR